MNIHKSFVVWALFFGSILCFLLPPFQSPDEVNHFLKAYQVSEGTFFPKKTADMRLGGILPSSLATLSDRYPHEAASKFYYEQVLQEVTSLRLNSEKTDFIDFPNTAIYAPTAYLPQALALFFGKKLHLTPLVLLYLTRLANLFLWIFLVAAALRILPFGKRTMAYLALLPASLVIAASCNADVLTNGLCFWVFAFFLSKSTKNASTAKATLKAATALCIIAINKIVFAPLVLFAFLNPLKKSNTFQEKKLRAPLLLCLAVASIALFWAKTSSTLFIPFDTYNVEFRGSQTLNEGVNPAAQLQFILHNPLHFLKIALHSYIEAAPSTAAHIVGKFGWEKNYLPAWLMLFLWAGLIGLLFIEKTALEVRQRLLLVAISLLCLLLFSITMYCLWLPVESPILSNLQGRYFVPILPLLCFAFFRKKEPFPLKNKEKWLEKVIFSILLLGNFWMLICVFLRFWH